jgi:hypothetical protein
MRLAEPTHVTPANEREEGPGSIRPRRRRDIELLGPYAGSGLKEPPFLVNTREGLVQLSPLLYKVAELCHGHIDLEEISARVSQTCGRGVSADNVRFLIEKKLAPLGIAWLHDGDNHRIDGPSQSSSGPPLPNPAPAGAGRERARRSCIRCSHPLGYWRCSGRWSRWTFGCSSCTA